MVPRLRDRNSMPILHGSDAEDGMASDHSSEVQLSSVKKAATQVTVKSGNGKKRGSDDELNDGNYVPTNAQSSPTTDKAPMATKPSSRNKRAKTMTIQRASNTQQGPGPADNIIMWFQNKVDEADDRVRQMEQQLAKAKEMELKFKHQAQASNNETMAQASKFAALKRDKDEADGKAKEWEEQVDQWRDRFYEVCDQIKPDYGDPDKVTDDFISSKWGQLDYTIQYIACNCIDMTPEQVAEALSDVMPADVLAKNAAKPVMMVPLVSKAIWRIVYGSVFHCGKNFWGGEVGTNFITMLNKMIASAEGNEQHLHLISRMKYKAAKDIDMEIGTDKAAIEQAANRLIDRFSAFVRPGREQDLKEQAQRIFRKAVKLLVIITRSRAIFSIVGKALGDTYNPSTMMLKLTDAFEIEDAAVNFFTGPGLKKTGTADGAKFGAQMMLCKAGVVLSCKSKAQNQPEKALSSPKIKSPRIKKEPISPRFAKGLNSPKNLTSPKDNKFSTTEE
ncbi:hypothetical protein CDD80_3955 [Ophiocordyceps camponoti-rufipedis]|uniref:Uncharacterized protein n=1 Tax=Ophiocordyceps camponoti-rufipedis TaxID=2004952 RepID=A0A2C5ZIY6_9HYPO|nr:hypothetical protein CDD80_3955 [Ophiocordyceps camponoti-rufipedis]